MPFCLKYSVSSMLLWKLVKPIIYMFEISKCVVSFICICFCQFSSFKELLIGLSVYVVFGCLWLVLTFICKWHSWSLSQMSRWCPQTFSRNNNQNIYNIISILVWNADRFCVLGDLNFPKINWKAVSSSISEEIVSLKWLMN